MSDIARAQAEADAIAALLGTHGFDPTDSPAPLAPADEALLERIVRPRRDRRRVLLQVTSAACVALLALVGILGVQSKHSAALAGPPPTLKFGTASAQELFAGTAPSASTELRRLADVAAAQLPANEVGSPHVESYAWYSTSETDTEGSTTTVVQPVFQSLTVHPDGSVTSTEDRSSGMDVDGKIVDRAVDPTAGQVVTDELPAGTLDPTWARSLPRNDPAAMRTAMIDKQGGDDFCLSLGDGGIPYCMLVTTQDMYYSSPVPSDVAASAWGAFADEQGVYLLGQTVDRVGRLGVAVAVMEPPAEGVTPRADIMIISPTTGQLLSWEWIDRAPSEPGGAIVSAFQAITSSEFIKPGTAGS